MKSLNKPIALVEVRNMGNMSRASNSVIRVLDATYFICLSARFMIKPNIIQPNSLCNGSTGIVCDIVYKYGEFVPAFTHYIWV